MTAIVVTPGSDIKLDPADKRAIVFDWDTLNLGTGVTISTSTWTITAIIQTGTALTKDNESILSGNRKAQVRLDATTATVGDEYEVANKIVTTGETPAQTKERSVRVLIRQR